MRPVTRTRIRAFALLSIASISGCAVPGHYLNAVPPALDDDTAVQDVAARADVMRITAAAIASQEQARLSAASKIAQGIAAGPMASPPRYQYRLGTHDVLRITVWNHPELTNPGGLSDSQTGQEVNEDGTFFYPFAGKIPARGRTVSEVRDTLVRALSRNVADPQVDVAVMSFRSQHVYAMGQLAKPGMAPITEVPMRVSDLVAQSGGLTDSADLRATTLVRNGTTRKIDLYALYYDGDLSQNVLVQAGDILTVPENRYNKVFVLGEVTRPQSLQLPRGRMSLAEALSDSGGVNPFTSNPAHLYVIRAGATGRPQIWYLDASSPDALVLADRFDLQARDIVYVDPAGVARFGRVVNNILPSATLLRATLQQ
ncbi:outer membrane protein involved in polysaccharide [Bordetella ansorpii]|uniref:Outer membrane protein involved in polysaccharide n=1 Tax=Bordetella ansorpii TaxID=288768 RepID=A0A157STQ0_9BORD|nr:polysaccharide biosynthesis/export family protein [Bordetella ansorpii]SAI73868.1 outer membrane protein involved in polysaccharide [Bordetella ansorpii]